VVKAVRVLEPGRVRIVEVESRPLRAGEVRLGIEAIGVCGSDVALLAGRHPYARYPVTPGHELGGRVTEAAPDVPLVAGQVVTVRPILTCGVCRACREGRLNHCPDVRVLGVHLDGGMAQEMSLPASLVFPVDPAMSAVQAAMVEPTAVAVHACHRAGIGPGGTVAILGTGVIGLLALQVARAWGAEVVLAIDRVPERLRLASALGAERGVDARTEDPMAAVADLAPAGFDVVLEMVGGETTLGQALGLARRGGTIVLVALPHERLPFDFEMLYRKELTLRGTRLYADDFAEAIALVASGRVKVEPLITHRLELSQAGRAMALPGEHPDQAIKVILSP
jgi:2-desacetyl-2-hydroxyethyl bacteriochlorophyllide A dehydrogenase